MFEMLTTQLMTASNDDNNDVGNCDDGDEMCRCRVVVGGIPQTVVGNVAD